MIGGLGRLLLPGPDPIGLALTAVVGIVASLLGSLVAYLLLDDDLAWVGLVLSVGFAVAIVWVIRRTRTEDERVTLDPESLGAPTAGSTPPAPPPDRP